MYKKLTTTAVMAAICILLTLTPLGFIMTPLLRITIVHLPVIFGTLIIGKKEGIILGLVFGLCSIYSNITTPTATSFAFYNPLVSVFPRVMVPVVVILAANLLKNKKKDITVAVSAFFGSLTNTVLVLGMIYILYAARYAQALGISQSAVIGVLATTAVTNGLAEAVFMAIACVLLVRATKRDIAVIGEN